MSFPKDFKDLIFEGEFGEQVWLDDNLYTSVEIVKNQIEKGGKTPMWKKFIRGWEEEGRI